MKQKKIREYTVKFEQDGQGGYIVSVPSFPEIVTGGRTLSEAEEMAKDAIACMSEYYIEQSRELPKDINYKATEKPKFFKLELATA